MRKLDVVLSFRRAKQTIANATIPLILFVFSAILFPGFAKGQTLPPTTADDEIGEMPYVSYHGGDIDRVNLATGNLVVELPFLSYPQRGNALKVQFDLLYNGKPFQYKQITCVQGKCVYMWAEAGVGGWGGAGPSPRVGVNIVDSDAVTIGKYQAQISGTNPPDYGDLYKIVTADNASHLLGLKTGTGGNCGTGSTGFLYSNWGTFETLDASGWQMFAPNNCTSGVTAVVSPTGVQHENLDTLRVDPNGNYVTINMGCPPGQTSCTEIRTSIVDTLGRQIPMPAAASSVSTSLCPTGPRTVVSAASWMPPGYNGSSSQYLLCYATVPINIPPYLQSGGLTASLTLLQSIVLPTGASWTFAYSGEGGTYNGSPINYGDLTQITLPTGGTVSYTYALSGNAIDLGSMWITSRTVNANDGTGPHMWNYSYGFSSAQQAYQTTVTDPLGNDTVHTFGLGDLYETNTQYYQGSSLTTGNNPIKTVATQYESFPNMNSLSPAPGSVVPSQTTTTWNGNNDVTQINKGFDAGFTYQPWTTGVDSGTALYGRVTNETDYDYGSGTHGSALRTTTTSYAWQSPNPNYASYLTNNLLNLPYSVQITGTGGNSAYTYYGYDESGGLVASGITEQKQTGESYPGNQTSVHRLQSGTTTATTNCNVSVSNGYLVSKKVYYDTGEVQSGTDPCGYTTTYAYSSTYYGAFPTTVTNQLNQSATYAYDFDTGVVTSITDPNSQVTTKGYDNMARLTSISYPDGGSTTYCYTDEGGSTCSQSGAPYEVVSTKAITSSPKLNETSTIVFDGLGRTSQTQLNSDPGGTTYTLTTYDADGRRSQVYNPTRCSPITTNCGETTWGYTTTNYDPLSRVTSVIEQDGSSVSTNYATTPPSGYGGYCTTVTDEAGKSRQSCIDGLGRMMTVVEDPGSSPHLGYITSYGYDALSNLTGVTQKGSNSSQARIRSFAYDSLSEITSTANPESGTITYAYDADGNLITKTAPLPNQSGTSTVTTTSTYDKLNRLTGKSYMDGSTSDPYTPTVQYGYDGVALSGCTIAPPNDTDSYPIGRNTSMCDGSGGTTRIHDTMGRVKQERRAIGKASVSHYVDYSYNLDGSLKTLQTPPMKNMLYSYGGDGRATQLVDTTDGINFALTATYAPPGELTGVTLGSGWSGFSGFTVTNAYNDRLQPILLSATNSSTSATVFSDCFDFHLGVAITTPSQCALSASTLGDNGNVYAVANTRNSSRTQTFTYDVLNRIASGQSSGTGGTNWGETYTIDAWGNLTNEGAISGKPYYEGLNTSALTNNQLSGYGYDAAGSMTSNGPTTYVYDAENRLVWTSGYRYIYDANGQRVEKCQAASATTACPTSGTTGTLYWRGTGSDTLAETDLAGNQLEEYLFFNGQRIARRDLSSTGATSGLHFYFSDHLGSHGVVESVTTSGAASCDQDIDYYPYGGQEYDYCSGTGVPQNYKFTGKERDSESGLDNFGARHDASGLGRFMQVDPKQFSNRTLANPQKWNKYAYVLNNPLVLVDPNGMEEVTIQVNAFIQKQNVGGFKGDNRSFSSDMKTGTEHSRVSVTIKIETDPAKNHGQPLIGEPEIHVGTTHLNVTGSEKTSTGPKKAEVTATQDENGNVNVNLSESYRNPFTPPGTGSAAADVNIFINQSATNAEVSGAVSATPSFEANFSVDGGNSLNVPLQTEPESTLGFALGLQETNAVDQKVNLPPPPSAQ